MTLGPNGCAGSETCVLPPHPPGSPHGFADQIDQAIATVQTTVQMFSVPVVISSTKRPFKIDVPTDMTDAELIEMVGWIMTVLAPHLRAQKPGSRIILPPGAVQ